MVAYHDQCIIWLLVMIYCNILLPCFHFECLVASWKVAQEALLFLTGHNMHHDTADVYFNAEGYVSIYIQLGTMFHTTKYAAPNNHVFLQTCGAPEPGAAGRVHRAGGSDSGHRCVPIRGGFSGAGTCAHAAHHGRPHRIHLPDQEGLL